MSRFKSLIIFFAIIAFLTGCRTLGGVAVQGPVLTSPPPPHKYEKHKKHGPPPHAPAHGYRHKHRDGHELEYHSRLGAYVVINVPDTYFGNNLYIKMSSDGRWLVSATLNGGWRVAAASEVPPRLMTYKHQEKYEKQKGKHKKDKHKKNKKHKWKNDNDDQGENED